MTSNPGHISTYQPPVKANYQDAEGYFAGAQVIPPAMIMQTRMVTTNAVSGTKDLRYAPHPPRATNIRTRF